MTAAHWSVSVLEGVAYGLRDSLELLRALGVEPGAGRASGGGARSELWLKIVASVLGIPIERTAVEEGAAYGAALLGGVAAGVFASAQEAVDACVRVRDTVEPDPEWQRVYDEGYRRYHGSLPSDQRSDMSFEGRDSVHHRRERRDRRRGRADAPRRRRVGRPRLPPRRRPRPRARLGLACDVRDPDAGRRRGRGDGRALRRARHRRRERRRRRVRPAPRPLARAPRRDDRRQPEGHRSTRSGPRCRTC